MSLPGERRVKDCGWPPEEMESALALEAEMQRQDEEEAAKADARNSLESFILQARGLSGPPPFPPLLHAVGDQGGRSGLLLVSCGVSLALSCVPPLTHRCGALSARGNTAGR